MSSIRQIITSQTNGAKSRGPKTPEGKQRSSLNAVRHGLLCKHALLELDGAQNFEIVIREHAEWFQPESGVHEGLIEEMAVAYWRTRRIWAMDKNMMDHAIDDTSEESSNIDRITEAFTALAGNHAYQLLQIYEGRMHRRYHRAMKTILSLKPVCHHSEATKVTEITKEIPGPDEKN